MAWEEESDKFKFWGPIYLWAVFVGFPFKVILSHSAPQKISPAPYQQPRQADMAEFFKALIAQLRIIFYSFLQYIDF